MRALANRTCIAVLLIVGWTTLSPVSAQAPQDGLQLPGGSASSSAFQDRPANVPQSSGNRGSAGDSSITAPAVSIETEQVQNNRNDLRNNSFGANVPSRTESTTNRGTVANGIPVGTQPSHSAEASGTEASDTKGSDTKGSDEVSRSQTSDRKPLKLAPPSSRQASTAEGAAKNWVKPQVTTTFLSLLVVLSTFFVLAWFVKRSKPSSSTALPAEAIEVLGRTTFNGKQQLQVVRFGNKLILLSVTQSTATSVGEITDPVEVERVAQLCSSSQSGSISDTFRQVLSQLGTERTNSGFLADQPSGVETGGDEPERETAQSKKRRWF